MGYSPWGRKESDLTEQLCAHTHTRTRTHIPSKTEKAETGLQGSSKSSGQGGTYTKQNMDGELTDYRNRQLIQMSKVTQAQGLGTGNGGVWTVTKCRVVL